MAKQREMRDWHCRLCGKWWKAPYPVVSCPDCGSFRWNKNPDEYE